MGGERLRCVLPRPDEPLAVLLARQPAEAQLVPHGVQARLVHAEHIAQGAVGDPLLTLEQRHHPQEHGVELALGLGLRAGSGCRSGGGARPDEAAPLLIHDLGMCKADGVCEIGQVVILNSELALEGAIGDAAVLVQHGDRLAEDLIERHSGSSTCGVTPQGASTAAYHTRTPVGAPCRGGKRSLLRLHTICGTRDNLPHRVSISHV